MVTSPSIGAPSAAACSATRPPIECPMTTTASCSRSSASIRLTSRTADVVIGPKTNRSLKYLVRQPCSRAQRRIGVSGHSLPGAARPPTKTRALLIVQHSEPWGGLLIVQVLHCTDVGITAMPHYPVRGRRPGGNSDTVTTGLPSPQLTAPTDAKDPRPRPRSIAI